MYSYNYRGVYDSKPPDHEGVAQVIDLCRFSLNQKIEYMCFFFMNQVIDQAQHAVINYASLCGNNNIIMCILYPSFQYINC